MARVFYAAKFWYEESTGHFKAFKQLTSAEQWLRSGCWDPDASLSTPYRGRGAQNTVSGSHGIKHRLKSRLQNPEAEGQRRLLEKSLRSLPWQAGESRIFQAGVPAKRVAWKTLKGRLRSWALAFNQWETMQSLVFAFLLVWLPWWLRW